MGGIFTDGNPSDFKKNAICELINADPTVCMIYKVPVNCPPHILQVLRNIRSFTFLNNVVAILFINSPLNSISI